jgi:hypothetical protein
MSWVDDKINTLKYVFFSTTLGKIVLLFLFIGFIYQPITDICLFFGIDNLFIYMYSSWVMFLFLLMIILRADNGIITFNKNYALEQIQTNTVVAATAATVPSAVIATIVKAAVQQQSRP